MFRQSVAKTLARLIRKSAEKKANNASATNALLMAAGIQPGEIASLRNALERASEELPNNGARRLLANMIRSRNQRSLLRTGTRKERSFAVRMLRKGDRFD